MQTPKKVGRVSGTQIATGQELRDGVDDLYAQAPQLAEVPGRREPMRDAGGSVEEGVRSHLAVKGWSHIIVFMAGATKKGFRKSQARATHVCVIGLGVWNVS